MFPDQNDNDMERAMVKYMVRITSYARKDLDIVQRVLACPTFSRLVFPAALPTAPRKEVRLESVGEYDISLVPKAFHRESFVSIPLYGENGLEFDATIYTAETVTPHVINLGFNSEHLSKGIVTLADCKNLISETASIFEADDADVYDRWRPQITLPNGGITSEQPRYLKGLDGKSYSLELEWLTYYGPTILEIMGRKRFEALHTCAEKIELNDGILVVLQEEPFDRQNPEHLARKLKAEAELGIPKLVKSG